MYQPTVKLFLGEGATKTTEYVQVEKAGNIEEGDYSFNVGKAWNAWVENPDDVIEFKNAILRHKMVEAIYRSAENGTRENYL